MTSARYIYIIWLLTTAYGDGAEYMELINHGDLTIEGGAESTRYFQLDWYYVYWHHPDDPDRGNTHEDEDDYVILLSQEKDCIEKEKVTQFSFYVGEGSQTYTIFFQIRDEKINYEEDRQHVQDIEKLQFFQCKLTYYQFYAITAFFSKWTTLEVIESEIEEESLVDDRFPSPNSQFDRVGELTLRNSKNPEKSGKILELFPKLTRLNVINDDVVEFFVTMGEMENLSNLHLENVKITAPIFVNILAKCKKLLYFTVIGEKLSGLSKLIDGKPKYGVTVIVSDILSEDDLIALKSLVTKIRIDE